MKVVKKLTLFELRSYRSLKLAKELKTNALTII